MKKILLLGSVLVASTAMAFGGGGSGRKAATYEPGLVALGIHFGGNGQADFNTCKDNEEWVDGKCMEKCAEGLERDTDYICTVCTNGNVYLSYMPEFGTGACDTKTPKKGDPGMECVKNSDCDGEYCKLIGTWQTDCAVITGGTCETLDVGTPITYTHGGKTTNLLLGGKMSWWAAENWCKAHHKSLVKASTLGCTASGTSGSCPSDVYSDMNTAGLGNYYWTEESYNSCTARGTLTSTTKTSATSIASTTTTPTPCVSERLIRQQKILDKDSGIFFGVQTAIRNDIER